jgi:hypothetical protein
MDHTAIIKFVETRFLGSTVNLTARDAVQPNLLDFFDFTNNPWATHPTPPAPVTASSLGHNPCTPHEHGAVVHGAVVGSPRSARSPRAAFASACAVRSLLCT